jgi:hypothetical protein
MGWFQMAYIYLVKMGVTYESRPVGLGVKSFGRKAAGPKERRLMFDHKLLIHATNTITGFVHEMMLSRTTISFH